MTHKLKRKIHINHQIYYWVANVNKLCLYPFEAFHIRVHQDANTKSLLYIDASSYYFKLGPKQIKEAIMFALKEGWQPQKPATKMSISINQSGYYILPIGQKFNFQSE
jgi:hypothetical protein